MRQEAASQSRASRFRSQDKSNPLEHLPIEFLGESPHREGQSLHRNEGHRSHTPKLAYLPR